MVVVRLYMGLSFTTRLILVQFDVGLCPFISVYKGMNNDRLH